jgi:hypothetical protein
MALPVAVALSGLNKSSFSDDLNDIYDQGAVLLKSPSMTSVASTEGSTCSQESGISSMASEPSSQKSLTNYFDLLWETNQTQVNVQKVPKQITKNNVILFAFKLAEKDYRRKRFSQT